MTCAWIRAAAAEGWQSVSMDYASLSQRQHSPLTAACEELLRAREASGDDGFTSVAIGLDEFSMTLYWCGPVPERVMSAAVRVRQAKVKLHLRSARHSLFQLLAAMGAVTADEQRRGVPRELRCHSLSPAMDGSGVEIVAGSLSDELMEARRRASDVPLRITLGEPPAALCAEPEQPAPPSPRHGESLGRFPPGRPRRITAWSDVPSGA